MPAIFFDGLLSFVALFLFTIGIAFFLKRKEKTSNRYLGLIFIILGISVFFRFLEDTKWILYVPHLIEIDFPFCFLVPPLYLFFSKAYLWDEYPGKKDWLLHAIPAFLAFIFLSSVFMMNSDEKTNYILTEHSSSSSWRYQVLNPSFFISSVSYFIYTLVITYRTPVSSSEKVKWIRILTYVCLLIQLSALLFKLTAGEKKYVYHPILLVAVVLTLVLWALQSSELLTPKAAKSNSLDVPFVAKYKKSSLTDDDIKKLAASLLKITKEKKLFLDKKLSLAILAKEVSISPHTLSEVINRHFGNSFNDFINELRIEYSKSLLIKNYGILKIDSIAVESGFNSRASFYTNFKKSTGLSPSEFIKSQPLKEQPVS